MVCGRDRNCVWIYDDSKCFFEDYYIDIWFVSNIYVVYEEYRIGRLVGSGMNKIIFFIIDLLKEPFRTVKNLFITAVNFPFEMKEDIKKLPEFFKLFKRPSLVMEILLYILLLELVFEVVTNTTRPKLITWLMVVIFIVYIWKKWVSDEWRLRYKKRYLSYERDSVESA